MRTARRTIAALLLSLGTAAPVGAGDGARIEDLRLDAATSPTGGVVEVRGTFYAEEQEAVLAWGDHSFVFDEAATADPDTDLISGYVQHRRPGDPVKFTVQVRGIGVGDGQPKGGLAIHWPFILRGTLYTMKMHFDLRNAPWSPAWGGSIRICEDAPLCLQYEHVDAVGASFDRLDRVLTGYVDMATLAGPGGALGPQTISHSADAAPFSGYRYEEATNPVTFRSVGVTVPVDTADDLRSAVLPMTVVRVGVAPEGTPAEEVAYTSTAQLDLAQLVLDVPFVGSVSLDGLAPGPYRVWTEACFGSCVVSSAPLTVTA